MATKYEIVINKLMNNIKDGVYDKDKKLPTEDELMNIFSVSRNTIRKAIEILVNHGYVYQVQGSGIFLRDSQKGKCVSLQEMNGLTKEFDDKRIESKIIEFSIIDADEKLAEKFKCALNTKIYHIKRVRYVNGEPIEVEESFYNKEIIPYLNEEICSSSIFNYITNDLKLNIGFADKIISCDVLTDEECELLEVEKGEPTLQLENTVFLSTGVIFDVSIERYNYRKIKLLSPTVLQSII